MLSLFFFFAKQLEINAQGYYTLALEPGNELNLHLDQKTAFIYGNIKDILTITSNGTNYPILNSRNMTPLPPGEYQIKMKTSSSLLFWVLDYSICAANAIYMQTENSMSVNWTLPSIEEPVCFFVQSHFSSSYIMASIPEGGANVSAGYHDSVQIGKIAKSCINTRKCSSSFTTPFFFSVEGAKSKPIQFKFEVQNPSLSIARCSIESATQKINMSSATIYCNTYTDDMTLYIYGIIFVIAALFLILIANRFIAPLLCPNNLNVRFHNLKRDPYATPLEQPNGECDIPEDK